MQLKSSHTVFITLNVLFIHNGSLNKKVIPALKRLIRLVGSQNIYLVCSLAYSRESFLGILRAYKILAQNCLLDENVVIYYPDSVDAKIYAVVQRLMSIEGPVYFIDIEYHFIDHFCTEQFSHGLIIPYGHHSNRHGLHSSSLSDFVHKHSNST